MGVGFWFWFGGFPFHPGKHLNPRLSLWLISYLSLLSWFLIQQDECSWLYFNLLFPFELPSLPLLFWSPFSTLPSFFPLGLLTSFWSFCTFLSRGWGNLSLQTSGAAWEPLGSDCHTVKCTHMASQCLCLENMWGTLIFSTLVYLTFVFIFPFLPLSLSPPHSIPHPLNWYSGYSLLSLLSFMDWDSGALALGRRSFTFWNT